MWLTHMQFYMIFAPTLVFGSRNVFVIMLTLVLFSLVASYVVDWIYDRVSDMIFRK
jgi:ABC-type bacteriocin/lantibiotic exporter with double-glycine peptidase domain